MSRILVVDDDAELSELVAGRLREEGFQVAVRLDGASGLAEAKRSKPDVVILDLGLPRLSGIDVCTAIRRDAELNGTSILMLTGRGHEADRVAGLEVGADDYVVKPCSVRELVARVRALLRRGLRAETHEEAAETLRVGGLVIDTESQDISIGQRLIHLTRLEFRFLHLLASHPGKVVSREEVLNEVWGRNRNVTPRSVDTYFWRLREKIEADPSKPIHLKTIRGAGFMLAVERRGTSKVVSMRARSAEG